MVNRMNWIHQFCTISYHCVVSLALCDERLCGDQNIFEKSLCKEPARKAYLAMLLTGIQ